MKSKYLREVKMGEKKLPAPGYQEFGSFRVGPLKTDKVTLPDYSRKPAHRGQIHIDQPFNYEEVIQVTGEAYVRNLQHDGVVFVPYEELKGHPPVAPVSREECIWMKARVINFRLCDNKGDCDHCEFDLNMRRAMRDEVRKGARPKSSEWADRVNQRFEIVEKPCVYALLGQGGSPSECRENYECYQCAVHERQAVRGVREPRVEPRYSEASGYRLANDYYYHFGHLWAHMERGGYVWVGIDDFAAKLFGKAKALKLPDVGASLHQGDTGAVMVRNGHQAALLSPISGEVVAVNQKVVRKPSICQQDAYSGGWLFMMEPYYLKNELKSLYFGHEAVRWVQEENRRLLESLGPEYTRLAATGGRPIEDFYGNHPELGWDSLAARFLHTRAKSAARGKP